MKLARNISTYFRHLAGAKQVVVGLFAVAVIGTLGVMALKPSTSTYAATCNANDIIDCGTRTKAEFISKYNANAAGDLKTIYAHYGLTNPANAYMVDGIACKDNTIRVGGKVVATGTQSIGRSQKTGDHAIKIGNKTYWEAPNSSAFASNCLDTLVVMDGNHFVMGIIKDCGNAIRGVATTPAPSYSCDSLTPKAISRTDYQFTVKATATNGATIDHYTFNTGDGKQVNSTSPTLSHTYTKAGTYTVTATVYVKVNGVVKTAPGNCTTKATVTQAPAAVCADLTAAISNRTNVKLDAEATATNGAKISRYDFVIKNTSGTTVANKSVSTTATAASTTLSVTTPGTYTAQVTVITSEGAKTSDDCKAPVTIKAAPSYTCDLLSAKLIGKKENRTYGYSLAYTVKNGATLKSVDFDFGDNSKQLGVAPADLGNVTHTYSKEGTYTTTATLHFSAEGDKSVKCQTKIMAAPNVCPTNPSVPENSPECYEHCPVPGKTDLPKDSKDCYTPCPIPGKEQYSKDDQANCVTPPPVVPELPKTGTGDVINTIVGLGSLVAAGGYYVASRRING